MKELFDKIGVIPKKIELYERALTHSSYAHEVSSQSYERLEFLGDAVIELLMSDYLYVKNLGDQGEMTKSRAHFVRKEALIIYAEKINLKKYIKLGRGEQQKGANSAIVADVFEAIFGAIYLDQGYEKTKDIFDCLVIKHLNEVLKEDYDYKTKLQEDMQVDKRTIEYRITRESGPAHDKEFEAKVYVDNILYGTGIGKKKQEAEQNAAKEALDKKAS